MINKKNWLIAIVGSGLSFVSMATDVLPLQQAWAVTNYQVSDSETQLAQFEQQISQAQALVDATPKDAAARAWLGVLQASAARAKGGLGALDYAKQARQNFERAMAVDPSVLGGTAVSSLATLYAKVPGWPVSFGDDDKARELYQQALAINPTGIDQHYFYAAFLADQGEYAAAREHLDKARAAPARPARPLADEGRRQAIEALASELPAAGQ